MVAAGERWGNYVLEELIGGGGMGEVYRARRIGVGTWGTYVCIKRLHPSLAKDPVLVALFRNEAHTGSQLHHGTIVQIQDLGEHDGQLFLAMEFVNGRNLDEIEKRVASVGERFPLDAAAYVAVQLLTALKEAHGACDPKTQQPLGIIHRDLCPHNVLVSYGGEVKLADFGVARVARQVSVTNGKDIRGRYGYMPLEQARGGELDARADLFALGVTLFELLTGRQPFRENLDVPVEVIVTAQMADTRPSLVSLRPDAPPALAQLIERLLGQKPEDRPESAEAARAEIETLREVATGARALATLMARLYPGQASVAQLPPLSLPPAAVAAMNADSEAGARAFVVPHEEPDTIPSVPPPAALRASVRPTLALVQDPDVPTSPPIEGIASTLPRAQIVAPGPGRRVLTVAGITALIAMAAGVLFIPALQKPRRNDTAAVLPTFASTTGTTPSRELPHESDHTPPAIADAPRTNLSTAAAPTPPPASPPAPSRDHHTHPNNTHAESPSSPVPVPVPLPVPAPTTAPLPAPTTAPLPAPTTAPIPAPTAMGTVTVNTPSYGEVTIDGRPYGRAPVHARLPAGQHTVRIEGGVEGTRTITLGPGGSSHIVFE